MTLGGCRCCMDLLPDFVWREAGVLSEEVRHDMRKVLNLLPCVVVEEVWRCGGAEVWRRCGGAEVWRRCGGEEVWRRCRGDTEDKN